MLRNVVVSDLAWVDLAIDRWDRTSRWSLFGLTPSLQALRDLLWLGPVQQQCVTTTAGEPAALVQLVEPDLHNGLAELALLADPDHIGVVAEGVEEFLAHAFRDFPIRKVGVNVVEGELDVPGYLPAALSPVGRLERQVRRGQDRFADVLLYELWDQGAAWQPTV